MLQYWEQVDLREDGYGISDESVQHNTLLVANGSPGIGKTMFSWAAALSPMVRVARCYT